MLVDPATDPSRDNALALLKKCDELKGQIKETRMQLDRHGVKDGEPLVTPDGFPRHDVDVATIRQLRVQLIRQENDMKALMHEMGVSLQSAFSKRDTSVLNNKDTISTTKRERPFGIVRSVVSNSAADKAGVHADDRVLQFGGVRDMNQLALELKRRVDGQKPLTIVVQRQTLKLELTVNVQLNQSLGCHIVGI